MKKLIIFFLAVLLACPAIAQNYSVDWWVIGSGGGHSESGTYQVDGTIGQPIVGQSSSSNYIVEAGFWVGAAGPAGCAYIPGDVNGSGNFDGIDVGMAVNFFKGAQLPPAAVRCPPCSTLGLNMLYPEGDANGTCKFDGIDIGYMVNHFKYWTPGGPYPTLYCPQCPPVGLGPPAAAVEPIVSPVLRSPFGSSGKDTE